MPKNRRWTGDEQGKEDRADVAESSAIHTRLSRKPQTRLLIRSMKVEVSKEWGPDGRRWEYGEELKREQMTASEQGLKQGEHRRSCSSSSRFRMISWCSTLKLAEQLASWLGCGRVSLPTAHQARNSASSPIISATHQMAVAFEDSLLKGWHCF